MKQLFEQAGNHFSRSCLIRRAGNEKTRDDWQAAGVSDIEESVYKTNLANDE